MSQNPEKNPAVNFGGGREAAGKPSAEGVHFVCGVLWDERKQQAVGLLIQEGFPRATQQHLIPWAVLPGRLRQELVDIAKYSGFRWPKRPEAVDTVQLPLLPDLVDPF